MGSGPGNGGIKFVNHESECYNGVGVTVSGEYLPSNQ